MNGILVKLAGYSGAKTNTEFRNDTAMYKRKTLSLFKSGGNSTSSK